MLTGIYPIVEGHGEVRAFPLLLRRFAHEIFGNFELHVFPAYRIPRARMASPHFQELERAAELGCRSLRSLGGDGAIAVLLDADEDCPGTLGPDLLGRVQRVCAEARKSVVVAKHDYEAWFLAAAGSLRGRRNVSMDAEPPQNPEAIRSAKEYLERQLLIPGAIYSPTVDQPALTASFDLAEARVCTSFDKLWRDMERLFA